MRSQLGDSQDAFVGGGQIGALLRSHSWSQTCLGAIETWPDDLKTAVHILLTEVDQAAGDHCLQADEKAIAANITPLDQLNAFHVKLTRALRSLTDAAEVQAVAVRTLGETLGATRVVYGEVIAEGKEV